MAGFAGLLLLQGSPAPAVPILNDPNGFDGIPWGATLSDEHRFVSIEDTGRFQTYERKDHPPMFGTTPVDSIRLTAFQHKFGRVTIRYSGQAAHDAILAYLQSQYGPLDRTPGQIAVGPVKVYAWHGFQTEVTLRFESSLNRGIIFIESAILRERWGEDVPSTVF
ncbi:MAG: hypothetical protein FJX42_12120 [Alphaproteobacteria bacterium]|nr:hypothetical protein [Alphaproteobacteria bacterium]